MTKKLDKILKKNDDLDPSSSNEFDNESDNEFDDD